MIILQVEDSAEDTRSKPILLTRSSRSSASALNLLTKPDMPIAPFRPSATRGLSFVSRNDSRNVNRGYAMGIPVYSFSHVGVY